MLAWLLEREAIPLTRIGRSIALRYEGVNEQIKYARSAGASDTKLKEMAQRLGQISNAAQALGLNPITDRNGRMAGAGTRMLSATELVKQFLDQESDYRMMSAVVHGHSWAINQLSFQEDEAKSMKARPEGYAAAFEKGLTGFHIQYMSLAALRAAGKSLWVWHKYMGLDTIELELSLEGAFEALEAPSRYRFWQ